MPPDAHESNGNVRIYASICSALILFWMVFASSFWVFVESAVSSADRAKEVAIEEGLEGEDDSEVRAAPEEPPKGPPDSEPSEASALSQLLETELAEALGGMTTAVAMLLLLFGMAAFITVQRHKHRQVLHKPDWERTRRLLLNARLQLVFAISTPCIALITAFHIFKEGPWVERFLPWLDDFVAVLRGYDGAASLLLLFLAFVIYNRYRAVSAALGIVRDITVYSTTQRLEPWHGYTPPQKAPPDETMRQKILRKVKRFLRNDYHTGENFQIRCDIEARFTRVLDVMMRSKQPDRVTIVSHSLGTIVATRCLGRWLTTNSLPEGTVLVTMGSPVTHIYRRYFPDSFELREQLSSLKWVNIFRTDDFVGTWISGVRGVQNHHVPAAGHSGYFTDANVWEHLREEAGLGLLPPATGPADGAGAGDRSDPEDGVA